MVVRALLLIAALTFAGLPAFAQPTAQNPGLQASGAYAGNLPAATTSAQAAPGALGEYAAVVNDNSTAAASFTAAATPVVTSTNTFQSRCTGYLVCAFSVNFTGLAGTGGLANSTNYYVCTSDPHMTTAGYAVATTIANCLAGTFIALTGTDSGTAVASCYITTTNTSQACQGLVLSAGNWDCTFGAGYLGVASTAPTVEEISVGGNPGVISNTNGATVRDVLTFTTGVVIDVMASGVGTQFSNSSATTIYGLSNISWTGGVTNPTVFGTERCRRGA